MRDNGNGNGNDKSATFYKALDGEEGDGKGLLKYVSIFLEVNGLCEHISQCVCPDCTTFWFSGGEQKTKEAIERMIAEGKAKPGSLERLKRAIVILNETEPVASKEMEAEGLRNISHDYCRLCQRDKKLEAHRRRQEKDGFYPCFGTKALGDSCDEERRCSHPCTIHPEREAIRRRRMQLIQDCQRTPN